MDDIQFIEFQKVKTFMDGGANPVLGECYSCDKTRAVEWVDNPFISDIHNLTRMEWLCNDCYREACNDI